jgi:hypothetical protein
MTSESANVLQIDREKLVKLLEAFVDTSELLQHEVMLYQMLFSAACKAKGLGDAQIQKTVDAGRASLSPKIAEACRENYRSLLEKLPQIVDLLASDQDAALRFLKEWKPKGLPN